MQNEIRILSHRQQKFLPAGVQLMNCWHLLTNGRNAYHEPALSEIISNYPAGLVSNPCSFARRYRAVEWLHARPKYLARCRGRSRHETPDLLLDRRRCWLFSMDIFCTQAARLDKVDYFQSTIADVYPPVYDQLASFQPRVQRDLLVRTHAGYDSAQLQPVQFNGCGGQAGRTPALVRLLPGVPGTRFLGLYPRSC